MSGIEAKSQTDITPNATTTMENKPNMGEYEVPELKPRFSVLAAIGIQYSISAAPLAVGGYLAFILGLGGSPYFFYGFLVAAAGQTLICISLAEIAAVYPHVSGQVFWTTALAPPRLSRVLSYCNGAATTLGWIFANTGSYVFSAQMWIAAMEIRFPGYQHENYQTFLLAVAVALYGVILNVWLFRWYPHFTVFMVWFINASTVYILVALLVRATPKVSAHDVFVKVVNQSGWSSDSLVFFLNFLPGGVAIACFDTAAHMAEEMEHPHKQVPQVMVGATLLSLATSIPMVVALLFCIVNPMALLNPVGGQPVFQVFLDGFRSDALLVIALIIYLVVWMAASPGCLATGSRLVWSFAKHGGLPLPKWLGHVDPELLIPVNAVYLTALSATLIGLLVFGPSTVLNGVYGAGGVCFFVSYGLPIWLLLCRGRKVLPTRRYFNLGRLGPWVNIAAVCWQFLAVVFLCFPLYRPVTTTNMNWASLCAVSGFFIFGINWLLYSRRHYHAPARLVLPRDEGSQDVA
ncbi:Choline transport protein [Fusarium oxysporum f. sp. rapae]|uniref:Choline transport protein n=1 Tax=Fusarium oxysporum f. sp. rapae TaxID=485398 RepID=A0A8J5TRC8_FUSOX|nr:Choline transport protein [Fusarium oxysporum f. sp. rapae]